MERLGYIEAERIIAILEDTTEKIGFLDRWIIFSFPFRVNLNIFVFPRNVALPRTSFSIEMNCRNLLEMKSHVHYKNKKIWKIDMKY